VSKNIFHLAVTYINKQLNNIGNYEGERDHVTEVNWLLIKTSFQICHNLRQIQQIIFIYYLIRILGGVVQSGSTRHVGRLLAYFTCLG
jgi:hypothetical protein